LESPDLSAISRRLRGESSNNTLSTPSREAALLIPKTTQTRNLNISTKLKIRVKIGGDLNPAIPQNNPKNNPITGF
jgi:hypothetical protein